MDIALNLKLLREQVPGNVKIVAVSKTRPVSDVLTAWEAGQRIFGENRVQELLAKKEKLPDDIEWHLIGHLQTNKVKSIIPHVKLIHSADSFRLISAINSEAVKAGITVECLLQFHIAKEETKSGFSFEEARRMLDSREFGLIKNIRIAGVMGMATFTSDKDIVRREFAGLKKYFDTLKDVYFRDIPSFREISMGMSGDFQIAVEEGSTIIRIGTLIFGERNKTGNN